MTRRMVWALLIVVLAIQISLSVPALAQQICLARSRRVSRKPGPMSGPKALLPKTTAAGTKFMPAILSCPYLCT